MITITLTSLLDWEASFLKDLASKGKSQNSLKSYRLDFECLHEFITHIPHQEIRDFNSDVLKEFRHFLEKKYPNINSRRRKLQTLRLFFDYLIAHNIYSKNPIINIASSPKALLPPQPVHFCDLNQLQIYFETQIKEQDKALQKLIMKRNLCLLALIYEAGISVALLSKLKRSDLIFSQDGVRVLVSPPKRDPISIPLKSTIFFSNYVNELKEIQSEKEFEELFFYANAHKIIRGGLSPRGIEEIFKRASTQLDTQITPKKIRQSAIIKWLVDKESEVNIKEWMGVAPSYSLSFYKKYIQSEKENKSNNKDLLDYKELNFS